jgi:hypothetical protein
MGYCMEMRTANFTIKAENRSAALKAIKAMADRPEDMGGGTYYGGTRQVAHYSWMNGVDFHSFHTFPDAMDAWRWPVQEDATNDDETFGDIIGIEFTGEKMGDDEKLFAAIAPFVEKGSYIEMQGEEGDIWRWVFDGEGVKEVMAKVSFGDDAEPEEDDGYLGEFPGLY